MSELKMGDELTTLMEVFHRVKKVGGSAKLTLLTREGKVNAKLEIELAEAAPSPSLPTSTATVSTSSLPTSSAAMQPAPGQRKRSKAARRKAKARAAKHQASLAGIPDAAAGGDAPPSSAAQPSAPAPGAPQRRPLCLLPSPPDGRRRVMSVGRREMPSISFLNLDGNPPSSPPINPWIPCMDNCNIPDDHCEDCFRCIALCVKHHGCTCDEDQEHSNVWCKQCMQQNEQK